MGRVYVLALPRRASSGPRKPTDQPGNRKLLCFECIKPHIDKGEGYGMIDNYEGTCEQCGKGFKRDEKSEDPA